MQSKNLENYSILENEKRIDFSGLAFPTKMQFPLPRLPKSAHILKCFNNFVASTFRFPGILSFGTFPLFLFLRGGNSKAMNSSRIT